MSEQIIIPGIGDVIADRYLISQELGRGAYGVVFLTHDQTNGQPVAVKTLLPQAFLDKEIVTRFEREAQMVNKLQHPNIIGLLDHGQVNGLFFMALEYVEGRSLGDLMDEQGALPPAEAQRIIVQILDALDHAHGQNIVHRDLKPENILLKRTPHGEQVKILDFGIAKLIRGGNDGKDMQTLTQAGHSLGTPHYMAPEQIAGDETTHQVDLYTVGTILYQLIAGRHPFEDAGNATAVMVKHLHYDFPEMPAGLEQTKWGAAMRAATTKQPEDRVASAKAFKALLEQETGVDTGDLTIPFDVASLRAANRPISQTPTITGPPPQGFRPRGAHSTAEMVAAPAPPPMHGGASLPQFQPPAQPEARRLWLPAMGIVLCLLAIVVGVVVLMRPKQEPAPQPSTPPAAVVAPATPVAPTSPPPKTPSSSPSGVDLITPPPTRPATKAARADTLKAQQPVKQEEVAAPKAANSPKRKPKPTRPAVAKEVKVSIKGQAGAQVEFDGVAVGLLPLNKRLTKGDKPIKVRVHRQGFKPQSFTIVPKKDITKRVKLVPALMME